MSDLCVDDVLVLDKLAKEVSRFDTWKEGRPFARFQGRDYIERVVVLCREHHQKKTLNVLEEVFEERRKILCKKSTFVKPTGESLSNEEKLQGCIASALEADSALLELQLKKRLGVEQKNKSVVSKRNE